ncbi:MAG: glycosyltransferase family 2 protein [Deltaproteobacteria bacterium]|nr:glycosyltransferase family 2 protein [Deltaproteobacteria bacterium]
MSDLSIIIVNWNTREILQNCLKSVYEQTKGIAFETIVVDNASVDNSAEMVRQEFPQAILIVNTENRGFAAANNQGMKIARGRYVLLLNPDTIVLDGAIQKAVAYADQFSNIGVLGCQVWVNDSEIQQTCFSFPSVSGLIAQKMGLCRLFPQSRFFGWVDYGWWDRTTLMEVDVVSGMFMLVRREAIDQIGLMDEDYFVYGEETDWCWRFRKAGWKCVFSPIARIIHLDGGGKSTSQLSVRMYVQIQKSLLLFHRKQRGFFSWIAAKTIYIVSMLVRYAIFSIISLFGKYSDVSKKATQSLAAMKFHFSGIEIE